MRIATGIALWLVLSSQCHALDISSSGADWIAASDADRRALAESIAVGVRRIYPNATGTYMAACMNEFVQKPEMRSTLIKDIATFCGIMFK